VGGSSKFLILNGELRKSKKRVRGHFRTSDSFWGEKEHQGTLEGKGDKVTKSENREKLDILVGQTPETKEKPPTDITANQKQGEGDKGLEKTLREPHWVVKQVSTDDANSVQHPPRPKKREKGGAAGGGWGGGA